MHARAALGVVTIRAHLALALYAMVVGDDSQTKHMLRTEPLFLHSGAGKRWETAWHPARIKTSRIRMTGGMGEGSADIRPFSVGVAQNSSDPARS